MVGRPLNVGVKFREKLIVSSGVLGLELGPAIAGQGLVEILLRRQRPGFSEERQAAGKLGLGRIPGCPVA
jgi:hypothetical protein